jgi:hypothetical protein
MNRESTLVTGGLSRWEDRPALVLVPLSAGGATWLHTLFAELANSMAGQTIRLGDLPEVTLHHVSEVELSVSPYVPEKAVFEDGRGMITWTCNVEDWITVASLMERFIAGQPGHIYLHHGFGGGGEVDVVLSFGEGGGRVRVSGSSG